VLVSSACSCFAALEAYFNISFLCCLGLSGVKVHTDRVNKPSYYYYYYYYYYFFGGFLNLRAVFTVANAVNMQGKVQKQCWNGFPFFLTVVLISSHYQIMSLLWSLSWTGDNFTYRLPHLSLTSSSLHTFVAQSSNSKIQETLLGSEPLQVLPIVLAQITTGTLVGHVWESLPRHLPTEQ